MRSYAILLVASLLAGSAPAIGSFHDVLTAVPDRDYLLLMQGVSFNGFAAPDAPLLEAFVDERVRFNVLATEAHTFHLHGHPWLLDDGSVVDTFLVDLDTPHAFEVQAGGVDLQAGDWLYHCHIDSHLQAGMWGVFRVYPYATRIDLPGPLMTVSLDRVGVPLDGALLTLSVDGVDVPADVQARGDGRYDVRAALPATGVLVVTAAHPDLGMSVARAPLGDATLQPLSFAGGAHPAHAP